MRKHIETADFRGGTIEYAQENFDNLFPDMIDLFTKHYKEIAAYQDKIKLVPDLAKYRLLEEQEKLLCYTVRIGNKLIGYSLYFKDTHIHYSNDIFAVNDILFIRPDYRKGTIAVRLLAYCELRLRGEGVSVISIHMKAEHGFERLCEYAGYDFMEKIYTKCIKE